MTERGTALLQAMNNGKKLYEFKAVIVNRGRLTYSLETKSIHPAVVKVLLKEDYLMRGSSIKTLGGWKTELLIKQ